MPESSNALMSKDVFNYL
jgi:hypothetical protein